jgi:hypothetical protein
MFGSFNKILDMLSLDALRGVSVNRRLEILKPKPKPIDIMLRIEKLSGKCILEKENDLVLRNLVNFLYHILANYESSWLPSVTLTDVNGSSYTNYLGTSASVNPGYVKYALGIQNEGDIGDANTGIVIGSGTTPPTRTDFKLVSKIPHGTGTGQISYQRQTYELLSDYQFRLNREFTNAGSDLSVAEAGLIYAFRIGATTTDGKYNILLLRDTFTPVTVTAGNGIRVRYTFSF